MCENIFMWSLLPRFVESGGVESADQANDCVSLEAYQKWGSRGWSFRDNVYARARAQACTHARTFASALVVTELAALVMSSA